MAKEIKIRKEVLENLYFNENLSKREIANKFGLNVKTIDKEFKRNKISLKSMSSIKLKGKYKPSKEELYDLYWKKGWSSVKIQKKYNVENHTIFRWFKEYNIKTRPIYKGSSKLRLIPDKKIISLYNKYGNYLKVARELGGRPEGVRKLLKRYIKLKKPDDWAVKTDIRPSKELAYILGVLQGDGSITGISVQLGVTDLPFAQSFLDAMKKIGFNAKLTLGKPKENRKQVYYVRGTSKNFLEWYKKLSLKGTYEFIFNNEEMKKEFIRGFYESEGSINKKDKSIVIGNTNNELLDMIKDILIQFNIQSRINGPYKDKRNEKWKPNYFLTISKSLVERFLTSFKPVIKNYRYYQK